MVDLRADINRLALWASLGLAIVSVITVAVAANTSTVTYDPYNTGWNGTSSIWFAVGSKDMQSTVVDSREIYRNLDPNGSVVVVLSPERKFEPSTIEALRYYVWNGGKLVIAEDFGPHGNRVLAGIGATSRFDGALLRDFGTEGGSPIRPQILSEMGYMLTFNRATAIHPGDGDPMVNTSEFAYLDRNRNGAIDDNERMSEHTVVAVEPVGEGSVVIIGDPSIFINSMQDKPGNRAFVLDLVSDHERVVFDPGYLRESPFLVTVYETVTRSTDIQALLGLAGLLVIGLLSKRRSELGRISGSKHLSRIDKRTYLHREPEENDG